MSIIVKGEPMPEACAFCPCFRDDSIDGVHAYQCKATFVTYGKEDDWIWHTRPNWCPLVELPEKHGILRGEKMPPKDTHNPELYVLFPDGKKIAFGEVKGIETISDREDFYESQCYTVPTQEYEFTCRWNPDIRILYFVLHGRLPSNNWMRMHGYRSCRKKR